MSFSSARAGSTVDARLKMVGVVILLCALIAPKASLALAGALGEGYRSVVVCTGSGLVRVTVAADGTISEDVSQAWTSPHCVPSNGDVAMLERAWLRSVWPSLLAAVVPPAAQAQGLPPKGTVPSSIRGPPRA